MKRAMYVKGEELNDLVLLRHLIARFKSIASRTHEKDWGTKLKTMSTYCKTISNERLYPLMMEAVELDDNYEMVLNEHGNPIIKDKGAYEALCQVIKRADNLTVHIVSQDSVRIRRSMLECKQRDERVTVGFEDLIVLWKVIDQHVCRKCLCNNVKDCEIRQILHALGCPAYDNNPCQDECEYHWESEVDETGIKLKE